MTRFVAMSEVGDGLCCLYWPEPFEAWIHFDLGSQQGGATAVAGWNRMVSGLGCPFPPFRYWKDLRLKGPATLVVSHFHSDHYNGLLHLASRGRTLPGLEDLDQVFTPGLPDIPERDDFLRALFLTSTRILGNRSGHMETDLARAIQAVASGQRIRYRQLFQGDRLSTGPGAYECIWPPHELRGDQVLAKSIEKAVESYHEALERDPVLARLDEHFRERQLPFPFTELDEEGWWPRQGEEEDLPALVEHRGAVPDSVREANRALRGVANRLSLGFRFEEDLLFLGDLEGPSLFRAIEYALTRGGDYDFMIAPHHGTKWSPAMENLAVQNTLVSNGPKLEPYFKSRLGEISDAVHQTRRSGDVMVAK